MDQMLVLILK